MRTRLVLVASALACGCWVWQDIPELNSAGLDAGAGADAGSDADATSDAAGSDAGAGRLIGYWKFDEDSGTTATDSSGEGNDGTVSGAAWNGGSLSFDGVDDVVTVPHSPSIDSVAGELTVFARMSISTPDAGGKPTFVVAVGRQRAATQFEHYLLALTDRKPVFIVGTPVGNKSAIASTEVPPDRPVAVAGTYDGEFVRLYIDSTLAASTKALGGTFGADSTPVLIGAGQNEDGGEPEFFGGRIDEVRIYSKALTESEVGALAQ